MDVYYMYVESCVLLSRVESETAASTLRVGVYGYIYIYIYRSVGEVRTKYFARDCVRRGEVCIIMVSYRERGKCICFGSTME